METTGRNKRKRTPLPSGRPSKPDESTVHDASSHSSETQPDGQVSSPPKIRVECHHCHRTFKERGLRPHIKARHGGINDADEAILQAREATTGRPRRRRVKCELCGVSLLCTSMTTHIRDLHSEIYDVRLTVKEMCRRARAGQDRSVSAGEPAEACHDHVNIGPVPTDTITNNRRAFWNTVMEESGTPAAAFWHVVMGESGTPAAAASQGHGSGTVGGGQPTNTDHQGEFVETTSKKSREELAETARNGWKCFERISR